MQIIGTINNSTIIYLAMPASFAVGSFDVASGAAAPSFIAGASDEDLGDTGTVTRLPAQQFLVHSSLVAPI